MTGEGVRNPYPHSRFAELIAGGITNGIAGNAAVKFFMKRKAGR